VRPYRLSAHARLDLRQIWNHIAEDNIDAADKLIDELTGAMRLLASMPGVGHTRTDVRNPRYRFWPVRAYLVIYVVGTKPLSIYRVIHGARNIKSLFRGR
jgi:toxin ParE1/3/4